MLNFRSLLDHSMFAKKPVHVQVAEPETERSLKRVLKPVDLVLLGIGAIVGTGVFVLSGVAAGHAGNALPISFIIAGIVCLFAALCYAEFSTMIPVAGSAYTYCYTALGEIWAWIIGWDLILEYGFAISAVAIGWSGYFTILLKSAGIVLPQSLCNPSLEGGIINLPAILIVLALTALLVAGTQKSTRFNAVIVAIKLAVILLFICLGFVAIQPGNWQPLLPPDGWLGIFSGAAIVFFAFIGFDAVVTAAEEVENPQKNLPLGIIGSLAVCMILYIVVAIVLTGIVPFAELGGDFASKAPIAYALESIGHSWGAAIISIGALCGMTSVLLVMIFGQSRILFSMSRDGLFPKVFSEIHPVTRTPAKVTIFIGLITAMVAGIFSLKLVADLVNMGTLVAFSIVALGVIILRHKQPDLARPFRCPLVPAIPMLCIGTCAFLIIHLSQIAHIMFVVWLCVGLLIYFVYGMKNSGNRRICMKAKDLDVISSHINPETPFPGVSEIVSPNSNTATGTMREN